MHASFKKFHILYVLCLVSRRLRAFSRPLLRRHLVFETHAEFKRALTIFESGVYEYGSLVRYVDPRPHSCTLTITCPTDRLKSDRVPLKGPGVLLELSRTPRSILVQLVFLSTTSRPSHATMRSAQPGTAKLYAAPTAFAPFRWPGTTHTSFLRRRHSLSSRSPPLYLGISSQAKSIVSMAIRRSYGFTRFLLPHPSRNV